MTTQDTPIIPKKEREAPRHLPCPFCKRRAVQETVRKWSPDDGWREILQVRCTNTSGQDTRKHCGRVQVIVEQPLTVPLQPGL